MLLELGFFTRDQLGETLRNNIVSVKLGALLVELGYLKPAELPALGIQRDRDNCKMLGEILVERFIDEYTLAEALAFQLGYPFIDLQAAEIDRSLLAKVPQARSANRQFHLRGGAQGGGERHTYRADAQRAPDPLPP